LSKSLSREAHYSLGLILQRRRGGDADGAAELAFEEALRVSPTHDDALVQVRGGWYTCNGRVTACRDDSRSSRLRVARRAT
jgi:ferric-dicitrate binding protein FerR (iron transport regulator)